MQYFEALKTLSNVCKGWRFEELGVGFGVFGGFLGGFLGWMCFVFCLFG